MRKGTGKGNILVSATKLGKCLLGDPMDIGRRQHESSCRSISPGGKGEMPESRQGWGGWDV